MIKNLFRARAALCLLYATGFASLAAAADGKAKAWQFDRQEAEAHFAGWAGLRLARGTALPEDIMKTAGELAEYSGRLYRVLPATGQQWEQSHGAGWILFDTGPGDGAESVPAFRLAHEWGHEALGHPASFHQAGRQWRFRLDSEQAGGGCLCGALPGALWLSAFESGALFV